MPVRHCSVSRCSGFATHRGRCADHARKIDLQRGTPTERGYSSTWRRRSREECLRRHPICQCDAGDHGHDPGRCLHLSNVADHFPESRKELIARGVLDPDAQEFLRGLCRSCHSSETFKHQPGGFAVD